MRAAVVLGLLVTLRAPPASADVKLEVQKRLEAAEDKIRTADYPAAAAEIDAAARAGGDDLALRYEVTYARATVFAYRGDLERAAQELIAFLPQAEDRPGEAVEFWIHNTVMMIREAQGDVAAALVECEEMTRAGRRGTWGSAEKRERMVLLKDLWHRAYLLRMLAEQQRGPRRQATLRYADAARRAYAQAAPLPDFADAVAVLDGYFAALAGDRAAALAAARRVNVDENDDVEDLYLAALSFAAGGDAAAARKVRERIERSDVVYLAAPIMRAFLKRDAAGSGFTPRNPRGRP